MATGRTKKQRYLRLVAVLASVLFGAILGTLAAAAAAPNSAGESDEKSLLGQWHLVRTHNPRGGGEAVSIMHTADVSHSDPQLAGLMIRCSQHGPEALIVTLQAFPLRARPHVAFGKPGNEANVQATVAAPGTMILFPQDAASLINGPWKGLNELSVRIDEGSAGIKGFVELTGLQAAFKVLQANCAMQ